MCRANVKAEAEPMLAALLSELAEALAPGEGETVLIGPVDFGGESARE